MTTYVESDKKRGSFGGSSRATLRHMSHSLRLLPSGSGRVHELSLRRDPRVTIDFFKNYFKERMHYPQSNDTVQAKINLDCVDRVTNGQYL